MTTQPPTFATFVASLNAPRSIGIEPDSVHLGALAALDDDERAEAEELLLAHFRAHPQDDRVAPALALITSTRAIAPLHAAYAKASGHARLRFALALAVLDGTFDATPDCLSALTTGDFATRMAAADALANDNDPQVAEALTNALSDEHFDVRAHAFDALLRNLDLEAFKEPPHAPLREIRMLLISELHTVVRDGIAQMRRIVVRLRNGETPQVVGLADVPTDSDTAIERILQALQLKGAPITDAQLTALPPAAARYVETALLSELHGHDPRIPRLLAVLGSKRAVAPLEEALQLAKGPIVEEVLAALRTLRPLPELV